MPDHTDIDYEALAKAACKDGDAFYAQYEYYPACAECSGPTTDKPCTDELCVVCRERGEGR